MLLNLAVAGYRSLREIVLCLGRLNVITGPNGSGKSNLYRSLRLLAETAQGNLIQSLAREGGLQSTLWAGPESFSAEMLRGEIPVQGTRRKNPVSLKLGLTCDEFCYTLDVGLPPLEPPLDPTAFSLDPIIKRECLWSGPTMRPRELVADRRNQTLRCRKGSQPWRPIDIDIPTNGSMITEFCDPVTAKELFTARETIRSWRFYDHFRTDAGAPARRTDVGTFTPVLANDGSNLAAALQTIREIGNGEALARTVYDGFPGSKIEIDVINPRFDVMLRQDGMLRPLRAAELSDGTLRYLLLAAALLTPRPPELMVLNEPETSLHPELIPALGRLIGQYSLNHQIIVVTHSKALVESLTEIEQSAHFHLDKTLGATELQGVDKFDLPRWKWPAR